ncbi:MAG: SacI homology domain-containing protein [Linnemannia gamsii]|nr:MAG: SacI homology domain-containing protein [Linnemannia gamsii]
MVVSRKEPAAGAATSTPLSSNSQPPAARPMVARPYSQLQLTIEPDCFILRPHITTSVDTGPAETHVSEDLLRILFRTADPTTKDDAPTETTSENTFESEVKDKCEEEPIALSTIAQEHPRRVSFISPDSYVRSESAKDYIIYGCVGFLDLYTGPHFIAITSVKALGDIEDKAVYAINKVAVLPMDEHEARQILDKLARPVDSSQGPLLNIEQDTEQPIIDQPLVSHAETLEVQTAAPTPVKSPKFRLSFLGIKQDREQKQSTSPSPSLNEQLSQLNRSTGAVNDVVPGKPKRIAFDIPGPAPESARGKSVDLDRNHVGSKDALGVPPSSPPLSPTSRSSPGFFSKLLDKKPRSKPTASDVPSAVTVSDNPGQEDVASQPRISSSIEVEQASVAVTVNGTDIPTTTIKTERPLLGSRSPSTFEVAEKFMAESTKQLADWGEEAVSGVINTTKSFSLMKPSTESTETDPAHLTSDVTPDTFVSEEEHDRNRSMDRRIIREISSIFGTGFYFSTELNLLTSMQKRSDFAKTAVVDQVPLWQQVDGRFWWNEHLLQELLEIEAHGYILPVMQGYVEIEPCVIEEQSFEFTLISRRSRDRSGLRYQRRGIDEQGNTANFVETEQLLRIVRHDSDHQVSFVQTRGSIPIFWSQSPYRLKPIPVIERTEQENENGFKKHFDSQRDQYGRQICINLVEKHGREFVAGSNYTRYIQNLAEPQIRYVEFDFHEQCKGMRYENIERLIKSLEAPIQGLGYCWLAPRNDGVNRKDGESWQQLNDQKGVIRTNCMDCLDRTNVVQSAISRHVLNHQLLRLGIASFPDKGLSVYEEFENIFNHVWANNGDAISREYAGTSALKGDFTRTGKRNLQGMINDATNSVARMYQNTFKDYFRQAAIDYLLGSADVNVFKNLQTTAFGTAVVPAPILPPQEALAHGASTSMLLATNSTDATNTEISGLLPSLIPRSSVSMASLSSESTGPGADVQENSTLQQETWVRIREAAIETSAEIVISPGEEVWQGWTFVCCSNEISSALTSASSPQASPTQPPSTSLASKLKSPSKKPNADAVDTSSAETPSTMFYDEKIVLLTERALYICTYDYEMEKVLEFWRLALEKMTGIDKGAYFLTAQDKTPFGQDPLENYGFAVVYRANAGGETLRVNSGSVRNRRMMGITWTPQSLDQLQEEDEDSSSAELHSEQVESRSSAGSSQDKHRDHDDNRSAKSILKDEQKDIRSVRFKIVKHPETSIVPYVTSSSTDSVQSSKANPSGYKRTAQDCVEWVVTEIVQARCELIAVSEGVSSPDAAPQQRMSRALENTPPGHGRGSHARSPSEEYNYQSPRSRRRSSVQVDLMIRDRVLQSLEVAGQLEKDALKESEEAEKKKRPKKSFSAFFSSSKSSSASRSEASGGAGGLLPPPSNNRSWLKKFQFGQDTDDETDDDDDGHPRTHQRSRPTSANASASTVTTTSTTTTTVTGGVGPERLAQDGQVGSSEGRRRSSSQQRNSGQGVFAKLKLAVKNL